MRILWFNHRDIRHPLAGGAERTIHEVGKRLAANGYEFHLASVNPRQLPEEEIMDGIIIHRTKGNVRTHLNAPLLIKKLKPDVVVDDMAHVVPWFSPFFTRTRVIAFFRHYHARSLPGQVSQPAASMLIWLERRYPQIYRNSTFVTETSTGESDLMHMGVPSGNIRKVPLGVDTQLFRPAKKTDKPSLVYFGGMREYKRPWLAIEVLKILLQSDDVALTVIGDGKSLKKMKELSSNYGLDGCVKFTGRIPDSELADIVASSWVNLHFSTTEGFGYSILEAAAAGTPTVALDAPGVSEVVSKYGLGRTAKDLNEFQAALNCIIVDIQTWSVKVNASTVNFSWDKTTGMWEKILVDRE